MAVLDVVIAPERHFDAVRETLADWCAAGLVRDHCWSVHADVAREVLRTSSDGAVGQTLADLAATERFDRVRLVHLAGLGTPALDRDFADAVERGFEGARVTRVRALFAGSDEPIRILEAAVGGWHTVLIAPEDGAGPRNAGVPIPDASHGAPVIAATLAGLLGLWSGHERSPLDDEHVPPDGTVRLVRSYLRRLDARDAERALRDRVLDLGGRLPLPIHAGTPTVRIEDVALASRTMAQQLWERHGAVLRGPREQVRSTPPKRIGAGDAIRLFLSFLGAALRNAPRRWLQSTVHAVRARTAAVVQEVVYGSGDSAYSVVVGGVTADGRPASWIEQRDVSERLAKALENRVAVRHHAPDDTAAVWQDYVDGALTLADAGDRVPSMPPVTIGTRHGVVGSGLDIVPGPESRFTDVSPAVTASIGTADVEAYDLLGSLVLRDRLRGAAAESSIGMPAAEAAHRLEQWRDRFGGSYAVQVGGGIAQALSAVHAEVRAILDRLRQAGETGDAAGALQRQQRRLTRILQVLTGIGAAVAAVLLVLLAVGALSVVATVVGLLVLVAAWAVSGFAVFVQGQRALFDLLNRRALLLSQQEVDERNLVLALRDVRRISDLYEQFLVWSRIIGVFLAAPLGRRNAVDARRPTDIEGLPRSVAMAVAAPGHEQIGRVATELRREAFSAGWLSGPWAALLEDAPSLLGARGVELGERSEALYQQRGDTDGLLVPWQRALTVRGAPSGAGEALWRRAAEVLQRPERAILREEITGRVRRPNGEEESETSFLEGTDEDARRDGRFGDALLSSSALAARRTDVDEGRVDQVAGGLGVDRVLVQLSGAIPEYELTGWQQEGRWWQDGADEPPQQGAPFGGRSF